MDQIGTPMPAERREDEVPVHFRGTRGQPGFDGSEVDSDGSDADGAPVQLIGTGGEHGLAREMLCSLPRSLSCRLCRGEHDCPYIVERPYGRLIVKKRPPQTVLAQRVIHKETGIRNDPKVGTPWWQAVIAVLAWCAIPIAIYFNWIANPIPWAAIALPAGALLLTLSGTVIGVPLARVFWRDRGGKRRGGAWKPSSTH